MTKKNANNNTPSHFGLGLGNEDKVFQTEATGSRLNIAMEAVSRLASGSEITVNSLMDYDACRPDATDLQGTYLITFTGGVKPHDIPDQLILRVKKEIDETTAKLASKIFDHIESHSSQEGGNALSLTKAIPFTNGQHVANIQGLDIKLHNI